MSFVKIKTWLAALAVSILAGCGGGGGADAGDSLFTPPANGGSTTALSLDVTLLDSNGATTTALEAGQPVRAIAQLAKNGVKLDGEIVQFVLPAPADTFAKIDPVSGSKLTTGGGKAEVTLSSLGTSAGAGRITATATVGGTQVSGSANFYSSGSVASQPSTLTLGAVSIGGAIPPAAPAPVSAYGTTSVEVTVFQNGVAYPQPVTVNFTTSCAAGKASMTASATTQPNGKAAATFTDNGCAQTADSTVTVTASIGTESKTGTMIVKAPTAGSLRFVSASPSDKSITLRGQGGNGRQEDAQLTFKLVDVAGQGVANVDICFDATTYVGGLKLDGFWSPSQLPNPRGGADVCGVDALSVVRYIKRSGADGTVTVQIGSGTVPTPVRVRARALYPANAGIPLETYSDTLSISTGLPLQRSFSLSVDKANIDGGDFDGEVVNFTARLADQFSNPVPDGTVVSFIASGGAVCKSTNGACQTVNGSCSCEFVSQNRRPLDNRVVVLAYADGEEDFDDNNGTNRYDITPAPADAFYDLGDAYLDANKDGVSNSLTINGETDVLIPYQNGGTFRANGDGVRGRAHIRASSVVYFSRATGAGEATAVLFTSQFHRETSLTDGSVSANFVKLRPICPDGTPVPFATVHFALEDGWGNPLAAGTTLTPVDISSNVSTAGFRPSAVLALGASPPNPVVDANNIPKPLPWVSDPARFGNGNVVTRHSVTVSGVTNKCSGNAAFAMELKSPRGAPTLGTLLFDGDPRPAIGASRLVAFDVRFRDTVNFSLTLNQATRSVRVVSPTVVLPVLGSGTPASIQIDWGDGGATTNAGGTLSAGQLTHTYAAAGNYNVTLTVTTSTGASGTATAFVSVP